MPEFSVLFAGEFLITFIRKVNLSGINMSFSFKTLPFYHKLASVLISLIAIGYLVIQVNPLSPRCFPACFNLIIAAGLSERKLDKT
jgi:hypothetical protein